MRETPPRPLQLKLLCFAFLAWSVLTLLVDIHPWTVSPQSSELHFVADFGELGFLAAIGLWCYSPVGFKFAQFLNWYWLIGSVLLFFQVFPMGGISVTPNSDFLANVPKLALQIFVIPFFLALLWQRHVLNRAEILVLFQRPVAQSTIPSE